MTLAIQLPDELSTFVKEQMKKLGYQDVSDYVNSLLEAEQHRNIRDELEQSLVEALKEPSTPLTDADFDDIRREGTAAINKRRTK